MPVEVDNLLAVARFKVVCRKFGITEVSLQGQSVRFSPVLLPESAQIRLQRTYEKTMYKPAVSTMAAARPKGVVKPDGSGAEAKFGGEPLRDQPLLVCCADLLEAILGPVLKAVLETVALVSSGWEQQNRSHSYTERPPCFSDDSCNST